MSIIQSESQFGKGHSSAGFKLSRLYTYCLLIVDRAIMATVRAVLVGANIFPYIYV